MSACESAAEIARAVRSRKRSAEEVTRACLDQIAAHDGVLHAFLSVNSDMALTQARRIDEAIAGGDSAGMLAGVPVAIKDNICATSKPTTCGSKILEHFHSLYDADAVRRLTDAGAILLGKTNLDEFGMGSSTEYGAFGPTCNPWDVKRVPGGSSGGSAAAVATGMVPAALGSDTGGSIRQPASFCGITGLKPTYGRVSRYGLVAYGSSLDQIGPLARSAADVALLLNVIAGHDPRDSTSVNVPVPGYTASLDRPLRGLRIGICDAWFGEGLDREVGDAVLSAVKLMEREGAVVSSIALPDVRHAIAAYYLIVTAEASSNLARYDGVHYGYRTADPRDSFDVYASSRGEGFGEEVKLRIMLGTYALSSGYYDQYYLKALKVRTRVREGFARAFEQVDVIASPVAPTPAFAIGEKTQDPLTMYLNDVYTISANLTGICSLSIPCGFSGGGLPIGLQLMGPAFGEERVLAAGHQYQLQTDHHLQVPSILSNQGAAS